MEGVTGMMARLSHMQRVAAGGSAMYRTRVFFSDRVRATVATSQHPQAASPVSGAGEKRGALVRNTLGTASETVFARLALRAHDV